MAQNSGVAGTLGDTTHVPVDLVPRITQAYVRYEQSRSLGDLDDLLDLWRAILELKDSDGVPTSAKFDNLALQALMAIFIGLQDRTELAGDAANLDEHIDILRRLSDFPDPQRPISKLVGTLGLLLRQRYLLQSNAEDLDSCIVAFRRACHLDPDEPTWVRRLIATLETRIQASKRRDDIDEVIELTRLALEDTSDNALDEVDSLAYQTLHAINAGLEHHAELAGDAAYLDERIDILRRLSDFPDSPTHIALLLYRMGMLLRQRYDLQSDAEDLDSCIVAFRRACHLDPDEPTCVRHLITALYIRIEASDRRDDNDEVFELTRLALEDTSDNASALGDRDYLTAVHEDQHFGRFSQSRDVADLDNFLTISRMQQSGRTRALALVARFVDSGEPLDLDLAIKHYESQLARDLTRTDRLRVLNDLSLAYNARFVRSQLRLKSDIDDAIACAMQAIAMLDSDDPDYHEHTIHLASFYTIRARTDSDVKSDLDKATELFRSVLFRSGKRPEEIAVEWYMRYVQCLFRRGMSLEDSDAVRESITLLEECARRIPASVNDFQKADILWILAESRNLALNLDIKPWRLGSLRHRAKEVVLAFADAANAATADRKDVQITEAFTKAYAQYTLFISYFHRAEEDEEDVLDPSIVKGILSRFIAGMSEAMGLRLTLSRRYEQAAMLQSSVVAAVATMLTLGDNHTALEWFEQGRAVVWSQIHSLRTPLDELHDVHPDLANKLAQLSLELESAGRRAPPASQAPSDLFALGDPTLSRSDEESVAGRRLAREHTELLKLIRSKDGFQNFLHPKRSDALMKAGEARAIACINVHDTRCDALIIFGSDMHVVRLPELSPQKIEEWHSKLTRFLQWKRARTLDDHRKSKAVPHPQRTDGIQDVLRELWYCVVEPILETYLHNLNGRHAHITWCTAGQLTFLPLHAAGPYDGSPNAFDLVVSSYAPNLSSLLPRETGFQSTPSPSILVVAQPKTPGVSPLPGTVAESEKIAKRFSNNQAEVLLGERGTTEAVLAHMAKHPYVHLACHGKQDTDPTKSAFILHDGDLTLHTLMAHKSSNAQLAFLSACETATGDETVPNEAVHLAAGMLAAGYKNVVATMWSIGDTEAPRVADEFYKALLADPEHNVAYALHEAVKKLREHVGVNAFVKWMPFIHFG